MKISICQGDLEARFGLEKAFKMMKEAGFDAVDFGLMGYWRGTDEEIKNFRGYGKTLEEKREYYLGIKEIADRNGIEIGQTHAIFGNPGFLKNRELYEEFTRENIWATHLLGCKYTVIHPIATPGRIYDEKYDECHKLNLEFYRSLIPELEKYDVKIAIEPMWVYDAEKNIRPTVCSRPEEILQFIEELGSEHFCSCPDLGHFALTAKDTGDTVGGALRKLGGAVEVIHAHEITDNLDTHTKPFTYGSMDWKDIGAAIREIGYEGNFNFEVGGSYLKHYPDNLVPEALRHLAEIGKAIVGEK